MTFNWSGQNIEPDSVVWRGARDGNLSSFKIGVVKAVGVTPGKATVRWVVECGYRGEARPLHSTGHPTVDSLTLVDPKTLDPKIVEALWEAMR
ncbi:hypothetical protein FGG44_gp60 [Mycobacterium phage MacnCheese]|uniref:Uncharacterized protein n=1 Tax=Mycobacterium phage MacnCheese TaxID=2927982 RepID=I6XD32_9CAUD|nr:hypothetical protein FGG44_gp60 [Mycobacterium phage MacnCheese]AFN37751.1 hypothetical protein MACNCHEESE_60 [Mycobacterium phage MacnCheese]